MHIQTFTGKLVTLDKFSIDQVDIRDIAHALANQCRFGGHCREFYSVAQHCVLCVDKVQSESDMKALLMHDAAEAYLSDVPRPIKNHPWIKTVYEQYESVIMEVLGKKYEFDPKLTPELIEIDNRMLWTEKRDLLVPCDWPSKPFEPFPDKIVPWRPEQAETAFIKVFEALFGGIECRNLQ